MTTRHAPDNPYVKDPDLILSSFITAEAEQPEMPQAEEDEAE